MTQARKALRTEDARMQTTKNLERVIGEFRKMLPAETSTAQAINRREPWESIAMRAVDDGYIEFANELGSFVEICLRRSS
jgi:hypothetical protein